MPHIFFQQWLDTVGDAFFADRFDIYENAVLLPLEVENDHGVHRISDVIALREKFDAWVQMLKALRATDMIRIARDTHWLTPDRIAGTYDTEILANGQRMMDRFTSTMILDRIDDRWCATRVISGIAQRRFIMRPIETHTPVESIHAPAERRLIRETET